MSDLTNRVKAKYPQYASMDDAELEKRVLTKYPQYGTMAQPERSVGGFASNVVKSGVDNLVGMGSAAINTLNPDLGQNTLVNMGRLGLGTLQKADPTKSKIISKGIAQMTGLSNVSNMDKMYGKSTDYQPQAEAVGKFYKDRYGGVENIKKTLYEDPTGAALDASVVLGGGAGLAKGVAGVTGSTNAARIATALGTASKYTNPLTYAGKAAGLAAKPMVKASNWFAKEAESLPTRGMGNPMGLEKAKGVSPLPMDQLFEKYNTWDRAPESFQAGIDMAKKQGTKLAQTAEQTGSKVDLLKVLDELDGNIKKLSSKAETSDKAAAALDELFRRRKMLVKAIGEESYTPLKVSPAKVTEIKQDFQGDVPDSDFGKPMSEMNKALGTKRAYQSLIGGIEEAVPGTKNLGREESALIRLKKIAKNQEARSGARQNVNFSKMGGAGLGGLIGGIPGAIQGFALEQIANSPQFLRVASKGARSLGNVFSKLGEKAPSIVKAPNLSSGERSVEKLFAQDILDNPAAQVLKQKNIFGKVLNTDDIRTLSDIYNKNKALSAAVHEPSSYLTNLIYEESLKNPSLKKILFTAGGTGSGKTSAIKAFDKIKTLVDEADLVYDTNLMNGEKGVSKIQSALDKGKKVGVVYTEANALDAWDRVINRAISNGRTVPKDVHLQTYLKSPEAFKYIVDKLGDKISVNAIENIGKAGDRRLVNPASISKTVINEEAMLAEMKKLVEKYYNEKKITSKQFSGLMGSQSSSKPQTGSYTKRTLGERSNVFKTAAATRNLNQE